MPPLAYRIRPIHNYGPKVGEYRREGTVPQTIDRARQELQLDEFELMLQRMRCLSHEGTE